MRFHTGTEASQNITINMPYIDAKAIGVQDKNNKNLINRGILFIKLYLQFIPIRNEIIPIIIHIRKNMFLDFNEIISIPYINKIIPKINHITI